MRFPKFRYAVLCGATLGVVILWSSCRSSGFMCSTLLGHGCSTSGLPRSCSWRPKLLVIARRLLRFSRGASLGTFSCMSSYLYSFGRSVGFCLGGARRCEMEQRSNQALERTAARCAFTFKMTKQFQSKRRSVSAAVAQLVLVRP